MDLDVSLSGSVPTPAEACDANPFEKGAGEHIGDGSPSHLFASHDENPPCLAGRDNDKPLAVVRDPPSSSLARVVVVASALTGSVSSKAKPASGTRSRLLSNQSSTTVASNRTAESTSLRNSGSGGISRSALRKKLGAKRRSKAIKKPGKTDRRSKAISSPAKIKSKLPVSSTAASKAYASICALSALMFPLWGWMMMVRSPFRLAPFLVRIVLLTCSYCFFSEGKTQTSNSFSFLVTRALARTSLAL